MPLCCGAISGVMVCVCVQGVMSIYVCVCLCTGGDGVPGRRLADGRRHRDVYGRGSDRRRLP